MCNGIREMLGGDWRCRGEWEEKEMGRMKAGEREMRNKNREREIETKYDENCLYS